MNAPRDRTGMLPSVILNETLPRRVPVGRVNDSSLSDQEWNALDCGAFHLLFERCLPCQILPPTALCRLPSSAPFLLGVMPVQGFLTPVVDILLACQLPPVTNVRHILVFGKDDERLAVAATELPSRVNARAMQRLENFPPLPELLSGIVQQAYHRNHHYYLTIDAITCFDRLAQQFFTRYASALIA